MRILILLFLSLLFSGIAGATVPLPARSAGEYSAAFHTAGGQASVKHGFLRRFVEKLLKKRLNKLLKTTAYPDGHTGNGASIAGFILGLAGAVGWAISPYLGFYVSIPFGLAGLLLSILGLVWGRSWDDNGLIRGLAIAGIVLNTLLLGAMLVALGIGT